MTVVAGSSRSGKSRLVAQLRAARPAGARWAVLTNSVAATAGDDPGLAGAAIAADEFFQVAGGCACCLAGPAFRATLVRLLRAGPWQRLHIEVDPGGHPQTLVDQLRLPPFDQYLTVTQLLLTLAEGESAVYQSADDLLGPGARLGFASDFLVQLPSAGATLAARLESVPPWPRLERGPGRRLAAAQSGLPPVLPGWRIFSTLHPAGTAENCDILRRWPAGTIARRRPFKDLIAALAADPGVAGLQALMHTQRAWYRWAFGRGRGVGALAFDTGAQIVETETAWRLDNRVCLWFERGARREALQARVQGLDIALQGEEGMPDPEID